MKIEYINNLDIARQLVQRVIFLGQELRELLGRPPILMEVCGTHTEAFSRFGLRSLLKDVLELRSGPGCPVCVTAQEDIDFILALTKIPGVTVAVFGDMMRVPGSFSSLEQERACGAQVKIIFSPREALKLARVNPGRQVILIAVGFETTAPLISLTLEEASVEGFTNFSILSLHKSVEPVLHILLNDAELAIDGFLLPGHVAAITGSQVFNFLAEQYDKPAVVAGFEILDILGGVYSLLNMLRSSSPRVVNDYARVVRDQGNLKAQGFINKYFYLETAIWRGFGSIPASGLHLRRNYEQFDARKKFKLNPVHSVIRNTCRCGEILKGKIMPSECSLFAKDCTPTAPVGPCMVSSEGTCANYYRYERL
ncbi:hydrogenase formation protein HypD [Desulfotomaculum defluvii]